MKKNIILTGFMGTGKSTIGRLLAQQLDYEFIDTDSEIEKREGTTIKDIFQEQGEAAFRRMEADLVHELAREEGLVIATGGGLVMNPDNVKMLQKSGRIICLTADVDTILARVATQPGTRPLLKEKDPRGKVLELLELRGPVYSSFEQVATTGKSQETVLTQILQLLN
ncbi:MAG: shikimate kinase [Desulfuromonas sp.]|nr:MAG: shikimate kinase [Desulfuromonas sp.]